MNEIEIFLQGEGIPEITLVRVPSKATVQAIVEAAQAHGMRLEEKDHPVVLLEDTEEALDLNRQLDQAGIGHRSRVHVHRCRRVEVSINFQAEQQTRKFSAATTVQRVKQWAVHEFGLPKVDATEHALQLCGSMTRPDEDIHLGTLVQYPDCMLCFDLVPKQRVEGDDGSRRECLS